MQEHCDCPQSPLRNTRYAADATNAKDGSGCSLCKHQEDNAILDLAKARPSYLISIALCQSYNMQSGSLEVEEAV